MGSSATTAMGDLTKLLWLCVNKNILMARTLNHKETNLHTVYGKPTLKDVFSVRELK